jgi:predicted nucleotidyltransferase
VPQIQCNKLFAFGSVLTDHFDEESDIDLIVDFDKKTVKDHFCISLILNIHWKIYLKGK